MINESNTPGDIDVQLIRKVGVAESPGVFFIKLVIICKIRKIKMRRVYFAGGNQ